MNVHDIPLLLYLVCISAYSLHLLLLEYGRNLLFKRLIAAESIRILPVASVILALIVVLTSALRKPDTSNECPRDPEINADIGGIGVLVGLFASSVALFIILLLGHKKAETSGAKELCLAHMANLLYLWINLVKSMGKLNLQEMLVACSSLDGISASVSMAISDKDVLAARTVVWLGLLIQAPTLAIEGAALGHLRRFKFQCVSQVHHPAFGSSRAITWSFWTVRVLTAFAPAPTVLRLAQRLNQVEHAPREGLRAKEARKWETFPATLSSSYLVFSSLAVVQAVPAFTITQASFSESWGKLWSEWGQSAASVVAMVAIGHVSYSFCRLFNVEAMRHRLAVCKASWSPTDWATPQRKWMTSPWQTLKQRSPFGKLPLSATDELLVDDSQLLSYTERQIILTHEERNELWEELLEAFTQYDVSYINDCLNRGAPIDRMNQTAEYPLHLAARLGKLEILKRTHFPGAYGRLLLKNEENKTPLMIAFEEQNLDVARWLLKHLLEIPEDLTSLHKQAKEHIAGVLETTIIEEKVEVLEVLVDVWPEWETLELVQEAESSGTGLQLERNLFVPFHFALFSGKVEAAKTLFPKLTWKSWMTDKRIDSKTLLTHSRSKDIQVTLLHQFSSLLTEDSVGRYGVQTGFELDTLCRKAVLMDKPDFIMALIEKDLPLSAYSLDDALTNLPRRFNGEKTSEALCRKGARDWATFLKAAKELDATQIGSLLESEPNTGCRKRMVNANINTYSVLSWIISCAFWKKIEAAKIHIIVKMLVRNGASVLVQGGSVSCPKSLTNCTLSHAFSMPVSSPTFLFLLNAALRENNESPQSGIALWVCCERLAGCQLPLEENAHLGPLMALYFFLDQGVDPNVKRFPGETPRSFLEEERRIFAEAFADPFETTKQDQVSLLDIPIYILQRWETFHKDPTSGKPTEAQIEKWQENWGVRAKKLSEQSEKNFQDWLAKEHHRGS